MKKATTLTLGLFAAIGSATAQLQAPGPSQTGSAVDESAIEGNAIGTTTSSFFELTLTILDWLMIFMVAAAFVNAVWQFKSQKPDAKQAWIPVLITCAIAAIYYAWRL